MDTSTGRAPADADHQKEASSKQAPIEHHDSGTVGECPPEVNLCTLTAGVQILPPALGDGSAVGLPKIQVIGPSEAAVITAKSEVHTIMPPAPVVGVAGTEQILVTTGKVVKELGESDPLTIVSGSAPEQHLMPSANLAAAQIDLKQPQAETTATTDLSKTGTYVAELASSNVVLNGGTLDSPPVLNQTAASTMPVVSADGGLLGPQLLANPRLATKILNADGLVQSNVEPVAIVQNPKVQLASLQSVPPNFANASVSPKELVRGATMPAVSADGRLIKSQMLPETPQLASNTLNANGLLRPAVEHVTLVKDLPVQVASLPVAAIDSSQTSLTASELAFNASSHPVANDGAPIKTITVSDKQPVLVAGLDNNRLLSTKLEPVSIVQSQVILSGGILDSPPVLNQTAASTMPVVSADGRLIKSQTLPETPQLASNTLNADGLLRPAVEHMTPVKALPVQVASLPVAAIDSSQKSLTASELAFKASSHPVANDGAPIKTITVSDKQPVLVAGLDNNRLLSTKLEPVSIVQDPPAHVVPDQPAQKASNQGAPVDLNIAGHAATLGFNAPLRPVSNDGSLGDDATNRYKQKSLSTVGNENGLLLPRIASATVIQAPQVQEPAAQDKQRQLQSPPGAPTDRSNPISTANALDFDAHHHDWPNNGEVKPGNYSDKQPPISIASNGNNEMLSKALTPVPVVSEPLTRVASVPETKVQIASLQTAPSDALHTTSAPGELALNAPRPAMTADGRLVPPAKSQQEGTLNPIINSGIEHLNQPVVLASLTSSIELPNSKVVEKAAAVNALPQELAHRLVGTGNTAIVASDGSLLPTNTAKMTNSRGTLARESAEALSEQIRNIAKITGVSPDSHSAGATAARTLAQILARQSFENSVGLTTVLSSGRLITDISAPGSSTRVDGIRGDGKGTSSLAVSGIEGNHHGNGVSLAWDSKGAPVFVDGNGLPVRFEGRHGHIHNEGTNSRSIGDSKGWGGINDSKHVSSILGMEPRYVGTQKDGEIKTTRTHHEGKMIWQEEPTKVGDRTPHFTGGHTQFIGGGKVPTIDGKSDKKDEYKDEETDPRITKFGGGGSSSTITTAATTTQDPSINPNNPNNPNNTNGANNITVPTLTITGAKDPDNNNPSAATNVANPPASDRDSGQIVEIIRELRGRPPKAPSPDVREPAGPQQSNKLERRRRYKVRPGDTIESIAKRELGSIKAIELIVKLNWDVLKIDHDGNALLKPGMNLQLPSSAECLRFLAQKEMAQSVKLKHQIEDDSKNKGTYVCRLGENLVSIAARHHALGEPELWVLLARVNNLSEKVNRQGQPIATLKRGQRLVIPNEEQIAVFLRQKEQIATAANSSTEGSVYVQAPRTGGNSGKLPIEAATPVPAIEPRAISLPPDGHTAPPGAPYKHGNPDQEPNTKPVDLSDDTNTRPVNDRPTKPAVYVRPPGIAGSEVPISTMNPTAPASSALLSKYETRVITQANLGDTNDNLRLALEVNFGGNWLPMVQYRVRNSQSTVSVYTKTGKQHTLTIDLPNREARELAENDLTAHAESYCQLFMDNRLPF
jgi:LysM domain